MKRSCKLFLDIVMYGGFLYLMSYRAGRGLWLHGVLGCGMFGLFLLHHLLNLGWYRGLGKGAYPPARIFFGATDLLLLAAMAMMAVSSVLMSGDVFAFSPFLPTQFSRSMHTCSAAWGFVLTVFHMGLHTHKSLARLHQKASATIFGYVYDLFFLLLLAAGILCFVKSGLWRGMLLLSKGDTAFSPLAFYGEYGLLTIAACQLTHLTLALLRHSKS